MIERTSIAKITRPRLSRISPRERIFQLLDKAQAKPVIWVAAPAGSGKTTLAASWIGARKLPCLWYQVDEGDGDLATFFYYMGLAAKKAAPRYKKPLPLLTPEYLLGVPTFTRRYFEDLFTRLKTPFTIVLDNYQDASVQSGFHEMIAHALDVIPEGIYFIVISRGEPPAQLSRLKANNKVNLLGWDEIRFTFNESSELMRAQGQELTGEAQQLLYAKTEGWAAGLVLMMENARRSGFEIAPLLNTQREVFDYFANEIFNKSDKAIQDVLLKTAFVPKIDPAVAEKLTGIESAGQILEKLSRNHYFTQRHLDAYQFHQMFREFLLARAKETFTNDVLSCISHNAVQMLKNEGKIEDAVAVCREAKDWSGLAELVLEHAQALIAQGRGKILEEWVMNIPEEIRNQSAWLLYWLGMAKMALDPARAQFKFERSYDLFSHSEDASGLYLSWCGIVESIGNSWSDLKSLEKWIAEFEMLSARFPQPPTPEIDARTTCAMFVALLYGQPQRNDLRNWAGRATEVMRTTKDTALSALIGHHVMMYHNWIVNPPSGAQPVLDWLRRLAASTQSTPYARLLCYFSECSHSIVAGKLDGVVETARRALELENQSGVTILHDRFRTWSVWALTAKGEIGAAQAMLDELARTYRSGNPLNAAMYQAAASYFELNNGQYAAARDYALAALETVERIGLFPGIVHTHALAAHAYCGMEEDDAAHERIDCVQQIVRETGIHTYAADSFAAVAGALIARRRGDNERALAGVRSCIESLEERGIYSAPIPRRKDFVWACQVALESDIKVEFVRELIRRNHLLPDAQFSPGDRWPYSIKIYTLERFEILKEDKPLSFTGKVQKKPLEILKILVERGGEATEEYVSDILWPEAEGDMAHNSFKMALSRLRNLIGKESIRNQDGKISLDPNFCWVDALAARPAKS